MDLRETSSSTSGRERSSPKVDPSLHLRLYFRRHMTDLVKLFGYAGLSIEEAKDRLLPLRNEYGDPPIMAAIEELVDIDHSRLPHWVNLKRNVLVLARQILGPPPSNVPARSVSTHSAMHSLDVHVMTAVPMPATNPEDSTPEVEPPQTRAAESPESGPDDSSAIAELRKHFKPADGGEDYGDVPRKKVLRQFAKWLSARNLTVRLGNELRLEFPNLERREHVLDAIIFQGNRPMALIILKKSIRPHDLSLLQTWKRRASEKCQVWRVWPVDLGDDWTWTYEEITETVTNASHQRHGSPGKQTPQRDGRSDAERGAV